MDVIVFLGPGFTRVDRAVSLWGVHGLALRVSAPNWYPPQGRPKCRCPEGLGAAPTMGNSSVELMGWRR